MDVIQSERHEIRRRRNYIEIDTLHRDPSVTVVCGYV